MRVCRFRQRGASKQKARGPCGSPGLGENCQRWWSLEDLLGSGRARARLAQREGIRLSLVANQYRHVLHRPFNVVGQSALTIQKTKSPERLRGPGLGASAMRYSI